MIDPFFDELPDGVCVSDADGNILYMNPAAQKLLDTTISKANGRPLCDILCGRLAFGDRKECASDCLLRFPSSGKTAVTFKGRHANETFEWKDFRIQHHQSWKNLRVRCMKTSPSFLGEGRRLTLIEDCTSEVEIERQKEDWRHMIAHDLRSPLTNIYATLTVFQDSGNWKEDHPHKKLLDISVRSCEKMVELLTLYLDVAKLDAGVMPVSIGGLDLSELAQKAVEEQSPLARERRIKITAALPEKLAVAADPHLLSRVLENVLNNAVKYTPEGGAVSLTARAEGSEALLSIEDTGPGIAREELPLVFDRFYQARARRAGKTRGTGLGLTFCREALKTMKGSIEVDSKPGKGSTFTIRLPKAGETP